MKSLLLTLVFVSAAWSQCWACDYCGGTSVGLDAGVLSGGGGSHLGFQQIAAKYHGSSDGAESAWLLNWTVRGSYAPHDRFRIQGYLPLFWQSHDGGQQREFGLGDILLLAQGRLLDIVGETTNHRLTAGLGVEFPTGEYSTVGDSGLDLIPMGSKSWDLVSTLAYSVKVRSYTGSVGVMTKYNSTNPRRYRYGLNLETVWQNSYDLECKDAVLSPFISVKYNFQTKDISNGFFREFTGGHLLSSVAGIQWSFYRYWLSVNIEHPVYQNLNNPDVRRGLSCSLQFIYNF